MGKEEKNIHKSIIKNIIFLNLFIEALSIVFIGLNKWFIIGNLIGTITVIVNYLLLAKGIQLILDMHKVKIGVLYEILRICIFVLTIYLCAAMESKSLIGYVLSLIGLTVSAVITFMKGEHYDKF